jgi:uncharacterized membrane protein YccC
MGGVFWSRLTPQEEVAKARDILADLVRALERQSARFGRKREVATVQFENARDAEDDALARMHAETVVTHRALMQLCMRRANEINMKLAKLDEQNIYVTLAQVNKMLGRAVQRVVGAQTIAEFSVDIRQQQLNMEQMTARNELIGETLALNDDDTEDADLFDTKGNAFQDEVSAMMGLQTESTLDALMAKAPNMADVRKHRSRAVGTLTAPPVTQENSGRGRK